jgi:molybdopterin-binding protein
MEGHMKLSARNVLKGTVKSVTHGAVNSEVVLELQGDAELVSIITKRSAEDLKLAPGSKAYAVIKASNVMIAVDWTAGLRPTPVFGRSRLSAVAGFRREGVRPPSRESCSSRANMESEEAAMGILRMLRFFSVMAMLVGGGLALWRRRDTVRRTWDSFGGAEGIKGSANQLMKSVGPVKDLVTQVARMK